MNLRRLRGYPEFILKKPEKASLYTSTSALSKEHFNRQFDLYMSEKVHHGSPGFDPNFSVGRLVVRLLKLGYKDIRLVGVDLFTSEHFYHCSPAYPQLTKIRGGPKGKSHPTSDSGRIWTAQDFLSTVNSLGSKYNFRLSSHPKSGTSDLLPNW